MIVTMCLPTRPMSYLFILLTISLQTATAFSGFYSDDSGRRRPQYSTLTKSYGHNNNQNSYGSGLFNPYRPPYGRQPPSHNPKRFPIPGRHTKPTTYPEPFPYPQPQPFPNPHPYPQQPTDPKPHPYLNSRPYSHHAPVPEPSTYYKHYPYLKPNPISESQTNPKHFSYNEPKNTRPKLPTNPSQYPYPPNVPKPKLNPFANSVPKRFPDPDVYPKPGPHYKSRDVPKLGPYPQSRPVLPYSICDNCRFKNGVGYVTFPNDCQAFIQCQQYGGNRLIPRKQKCPHNLFWNQDILTCDHPTNTKCQWDPCLTTKGMTSPVYGNCAAYHQCDHNQRTSAIFCCAYGYRYERGYGFHGYSKSGHLPCVKASGCNDRCGPKKESTKNEVCRRFPVPGFPTKYQEVVNYREFIRPCAPGTAFVHAKCGCSVAFNLPPAKGCKPTVFIDFKYDIKDVSGNWVSVGNEWNGVKSIKVPWPEDGYAGEFHNAKLILWRFANAPLGPPLKIDFSFLEKPLGNMRTGEKETLVSNGDCGKKPSVAIVFDRTSRTVSALVDTQGGYGKTAIVSVPYAPEEYKHVSYLYDGRYLILSVNSASSRKTDFVQVSGKLRVVQCALSLGEIKGGTPFYGLLDDFKLWLCLGQTSSPPKIAFRPSPSPSHPAPNRLPPSASPQVPRPFPSPPRPSPPSGSSHIPRPFPSSPSPSRPAPDPLPSSASSQMSRPFPSSPSPSRSTRNPVPPSASNATPQMPQPFPSSSSPSRPLPNPLPPSASPKMSRPFPSSPSPSRPAPYPFMKGNRYPPTKPEQTEYHPSQYHSQKPDNQQSHAKKSDNQQYYPQMPDNQQYRPQKPDNQQYHPRIPDNQKYHPRIPDNQRYRPQKPDNQQYHPRIPDNQQHYPQMPDNQQYHPQKPDNQQYHPRIPDNQQYHPQMPDNQQYHPQKPDNQQYHPQIPDNQHYSPQKLDNQQYPPRKPGNYLYRPLGGQPRRPTISSTETRLPTTSSTEPAISS